MTRRMGMNLDDEQLMSFLLKFVCGIPIQCNQIRLVDLYGNKKAFELFQTTTDNVNYFITHLKKKTGKGKNFNRAIVGGGSWKGLDNSKPVYDKNGSVIGFKKTFRFLDDDDNRPSNIHMKEYHLSDKIVHALRQRRQIRHEDFVVCRVTRNVKSSKVVPLDHSGENFVASYVPISSSQHQQNTSFSKSSLQYQFRENQDFGHVNAAIIPSDQLSSILNGNVNLSHSGQNFVSSYLPISSSSQHQENAKSYALLHQFQENQDFGRDVIPRDELSSILNGNSQLSLLTTKSSVAPLISTEEEEGCSVPTVKALDQETPFVSAEGHQFQENQEFGPRIPCAEFSNLLNGNSQLSLLTTESNVAPITQFPLISTEEEEGCSVSMVYALDQQTPSVVSASAQGPNNDIASYHKQLDAYAAAILEFSPISVPPYIPQDDEDQCPLFSEDFYIGHTALWSKSSRFT